MRNLYAPLGDRIVAIRRVLAPLTEVRILVPQPLVPSSSGLGYRPLTAETRVRVPLGLPAKCLFGTFRFFLWRFHHCCACYLGYPPILGCPPISLPIPQETAAMEIRSKDKGHPQVPPILGHPHTFRVPRPRHLKRHDLHSIQFFPLKHHLPPIMIAKFNLPQ